MIPIVPAIIPKSEEELKQSLVNLSFAEEIQIDVVDGKFVPFVSWPYNPPGSPFLIRDEAAKCSVEIDLMVTNPIEAGQEWLEAGADMLVFHIESINLESFRAFVNTTSVSVGVSALNDTPLENLYPYAEIADYVQLMGIAEIGAQGQSFDDRVLERIKVIKQKFPNHPISIDGSVNQETILLLKRAGANRFIAGSAIVGASDPYTAYKNLVSLANQDK
ncbi:MAG: hypothetical protein H6779_01510 [Candidatus Nomurabacteria bacterium]|nr:MAG: hypothetical protein H6779_01510 [Candidatus Nomurabacteria bacterium]